VEEAVKASEGPILTVVSAPKAEPEVRPEVQAEEPAAAEGTEAPAKTTSLFN
jgi:hypothetical protein